MANDLLTASKIAQQLKLKDAQVKKALSELKISPAATKGPCKYYSPDVVAKIRTAVK
ncbi:MAG: hypothetical protein HYZ28_25660 [Myxococcales bacterium]|nr:hypothetical protein [Myxococcales bacterium]